jgi:hypothetical protein
MTSASAVERLEESTNKQKNREILANIVCEVLGKVKSPIAHTLCGKSALFEKLLLSKKDFKIKCYENNDKVFEVAKKSVPKNAKLVFGEWMEHNFDQRTPDFCWADYCGTPTRELMFLTLFELKRHIASKKKFVYAVTFSIPTRIKGGMYERIRELSKITKTKKTDIEGSDGYLQMLVKYFYQHTGLVPHTATLYGGSKGEKVPMTTIIWTSDKNLVGERWKHSNTLGSEQSVFVNMMKKAVEAKQDTKRKYKLEGEVITGVNGKLVARHRSEACKRAWDTIRLNRLLKSMK